MRHWGAGGSARQSAGKGTYDDVVRLELERVGLEAFRAESLAVDEGAVGAFHVFDVNLRARWWE